MTNIYLQNYIDSLFRIEQGCGSVDDLIRKDDFIFLACVDKDVSSFSELELKGLEIASAKARSKGCTIKAFDRIEDVPIQLEDKAPRQIIKQDVPVPVRKAEPMYEDINLLVTLCQRENVLNQLDLMDVAASALGKSRQTLTIKDFPCDYFPQGFLDSPSESGVDTVEFIEKKVIFNLPFSLNYDFIVTIWAEDSKAFMRYSKAFECNRIIVVYPSDRDSSKHDKYSGFAKEANPDIKISSYKFKENTSEIGKMDPLEFMSRIGATKNSIFISNYVPYSYGLGRHFRSSLCLFLDHEYVETSVIAPIPYVDVNSHSYVSQFYQFWLMDNYPDIVKNGRGGLFDPVRSQRLSYSQHGAFLDDIVESSLLMFDGSIVDRVDRVMGLNVSVPLKVIYHDRGILDDHVHNINFNISDSDLILVSPSNESIQVSKCYIQGSSPIFSPAIPYVVYESDPYGNVNTDGLNMVGFPPLKELRVVVIDSVPFVLDIKYAIKPFYDRRELIPFEYRLPLSSWPAWRKSYVTWSNTAVQFGTFFVDVEEDVSISQSVRSGEFEQYTIMGIAWVPKLARMCFNGDSYLYMSKLNFAADYLPPPTRHAEFSDQYGVRKSLRLSIEDSTLDSLYHVEVTAVKDSLNRELVTAEDMDMLILNNIPVDLRNPIASYMIPYFLDHSDFTIQRDGVNSYVQNGFIVDLLGANANNYMSRVTPRTWCARDRDIREYYYYLEDIEECRVFKSSDIRILVSGSFSSISDPEFRSSYLYYCLAYDVMS
jgi:hypothetical protein